MSALALSFFAAADTTTAYNSDIIVPQTKPYTAGRFDGVMMAILMIVIGGTSLASFGQIDTAAVQNGIEDFSHYRD
jgi:hypothetical protein